MDQAWSSDGIEFAPWNRSRIEIVEVGPRDGLQSESQVLPTGAKVEFIRRLAGAGLRRIEVASFVNPKRVPQMADAEAVLAALAPVSVARAFHRPGAEPQRLRARAAPRAAPRSAWPSPPAKRFSQRNQGCSVEEGVEAWLDIASARQAAGIRAQITISTAFGCPFEGEVPVDRVIALSRSDWPPESRMRLPSPTPSAWPCPRRSPSCIGLLRASLPRVKLRAHFHNTRNTGLANAYAAVEAGVRALDASCGGIGGCPFAPAATGNIPTEDLIYMLHRMGFDTGVDLPALLDTSRWLQQTLDHAVPGMLVKAGLFPAAHETEFTKEYHRWRSRLATRCPRAHSRR